MILRPLPRRVQEELVSSRILVLGGELLLGQPKSNGLDVGFGVTPAKGRTRERKRMAVRLETRLVLRFFLFRKRRHR